jgi:hypothetical protein
MRWKWRTARICCASSVSGMRLAAVHVDETWDDCRSLDFPHLQLGKNFCGFMQCLALEAFEIDEHAA